MRFNKFFRLETGRFLNRRKLIILILFYLLSVYFVQSGIGQYKEGSEEIKRFQEFEKERVDNFQFYLQYGGYGFRLLYVPGPLSGLFSNAGIITSNLNALIDSGERMKIYETFKGKNVFVGYTSIFLNLSGLLFLLGSLLSLFYGFESFQDRDFLKLLDSTGSRKNIFWSVVASRLLLLLGCCLVITFSIWILYIVNGLALKISHLLIYGLVVFLMAAFFLFVGILAGDIKNKRGLVAIFSVWLLFIFGLPAIVGKIVHNRAKSIISTYEMDTKKFKLMMKFENIALDTAGRMDKNNTKAEIRQQLFNYLWDNEFREIMEQEKTMISEMRNVISLHHNLSLIFPTSFFLSVNNEISGRGYENLLSFYEYTFKHKKGFVKYYGEKAFFSGEKTVKPYLKGNTNIFNAPSLLPGNFGFGLVIGFFWLLLLLFLNWLAFNRLLDWLPESETEIKHLKLDELKKSKITAVLTFNPAMLANFLETLRRQKSRFLFAPGPDSMPEDVKVKSLFDFFGLAVPDRLQEMAGQYVGDLKSNYKALVVLEVARSYPETEIFVFNDFLTGLSGKFADYFADTLGTLKKGRKIVYFTTSGPKVGDNVIRRANEQQPF